MKNHLIDRIIPNELPDVSALEKRYPPRSGHPTVTRFAPSPTGFLHLGGIYSALISSSVARQAGGVFLLRIEDTDKLREVPGAVALLGSTLKKFGLEWAEGETLDGGEIGSYGPYRQGLRKALYHGYARDLMRKGLAYPCFATRDELDAISESQRQAGLNPGYYGRWATWRDRAESDVDKALDSGADYVIRFRSHGDENARISFKDVIRGQLELPQNCQDVVLLKADGLPTYHFAHVVDDHLMRTTHVIRGDEWLSSVPLHLALFEAIDAAVPFYGHIAPLQVQDGDSRRKLSKRKDVTADARFYLAAGFPADAVKAYLLTVATSRFEGWRKANKTISLDDFPLSLKDLGASGALLDLEKLESISKSYFVEQPIDRLVAEGLGWAADYDNELYALWQHDPGYLTAVLATQRANPSRPRKDLGKWSDFRPALGFFYDSLFERDADIEEEMNELLGCVPVLAAIGTIIERLQSVSDAAGFTAMLRDAAEAHGLNQSRPSVVGSPSVHISALYSSLKFLLCGKRDSMDLWVLISTMGLGRAISRLNAPQVI